MAHVEARIVGDLPWVHLSPSVGPLGMLGTKVSLRATEGKSSEYDGRPGVSVVGNQLSPDCNSDFSGVLPKGLCWIIHPDSILDHQVGHVTEAE